MICRKCKKELPDEAVYCLYCGAKQVEPRRDRRVKSRGNGQGCVIRLPNGKWRAEVTLYYYTDAEGKKHRKAASKQCNTKTEALRIIPELLAKKGLLRAEAFTVKALYDIYTHTKAYDGLSDSQRMKLDIAWKRLSALQNLNINLVTIDDMQRVIDSEAKTYYPARDMKVLLSHIFDAGIKREAVQYNKTAYIELPDAPKAKRERFTDEELKKLFEYQKRDSFAGYILIMSFLGLRPGELRTLKMENIHLDEDYIVCGIKTAAGIDREIPIPACVQDIFRRFCEEAGDRELFFTIDETTMYDRYYDVLENAGVRKLTPRVCRHTYFSMLAAAGVGAELITEIGGHSDYNTTHKNYVRITVDEKRKAVSVLDDFGNNVKKSEGAEQPSDTDSFDFSAQK